MRVENDNPNDIDKQGEDEKLKIDLPHDYPNDSSALFFPNEPTIFVT